MKKYMNLLFAAALILPATVNAQNEIDALRYGRLSSGATARSLGLGGTGGSFGGDFSSLSINPAGIGVYRSSEIMVTPMLRFNNMTGKYLDASSSDNNTRLTLSNFGLVFSNAAKGRRYETSDWKSFSVGIGYNRMADFNSHGQYSGKNDVSSITEVFAADAQANGTSTNLIPPFGYFAYYGFLLDDALNSIPYGSILSKGGAVNQSKSWESKGGINEWTLSLGGNFREKLMLGASLGLTSYKYDRNTNYTESDATGNKDNDFDYLSYNEYLSTTGIGVNLKVGAIYVVNDVFRFGGAIHTPTWAAYTDAMDYDITTNTENLKERTGQAETNPYTFLQPGQPSQIDYSLRTPWRGVLSATAFFGKFGFITADYEYVAYQSMRYNFSGNTFNDYENSVNTAIKDTYTGGHNFRVGIEGRKDNYLARLGFAYHTSPYQRAGDFDGQRMDLSAGLGARFGSFFVDLAYMHMIQKEAEYGYPILAKNVPVGIASLNYGNNLVALTLGFKF
jgi:hypothetical protein